MKIIYQPCWDDLIIKSRFDNDVEGDLDDTWDTPAPDVVTVSPKPKQRTEQQPDKDDSAQSSLPDEPGPSPDKESPSVSGEPHEPPSPVPTISPTEVESTGPRRSTRVRKPVDRFTPDKAHGYPNIIKYTYKLIKCIQWRH